MTPTFAHPWALLLLAALPFLAWRWRRRHRASLTLPAASALASLPPGRSRGAERGGLWLRVAGMTALVIALAGPRWPDEGSRIPTEGISIAFVLDASHSMSEIDFRWGDDLLSRFDGVKKVFRLLAEGGAGLKGETFAGRPQDLLALVLFATRPETTCPLTLDHATLLQILDAEQPRSVITEATSNPGDAVAWALVALQKAPTRRKAIILLTDGESNVPPPAFTPRQAAQLAGNLRVPIYAIDAAPVEDVEGDAVKREAVKGDAEKAQQTLREIATLTQGRYFRATDGAELTQALHAIDQLERDVIQSFQYRRYDEGYPWFALAALACWLLVIGLETTWWRKVP